MFFSILLCLLFGLPLDSRFRGNDDKGQGGWYGRLLRKPDSGKTALIFRISKKESDSFYNKK
jgi:hypothetical protein